MKKDRTEYLEYGLLAVASMIIFLMVLHIFTGEYIWKHNTYNTYALQADSWRQGRLDLGENYSWLEIAEYQGKFYCSFPPFPSYVLFPLTFIFGSGTPDGIVLLLFDLIAVIFLYKTAFVLKLSPRAAAFSALFFTICTNMAFVCFVPSVWFFAQSINYSLSAAAIYFALTQRGGWSLLLWSCSVGCRPMQVLFLPVLLLILYYKEKKSYPERKWFELIWHRVYWGIMPLGIAISYMALNYARFRNILEFGHNYLPEFVYEHKQFSIDYLAHNFKMLMNFPRFSEDGKMLVDHFGNLNFCLVNPPVLVFLICILAACMKREKDAALLGVLTFFLAVAYLTVTAMHATMGGWHFGNRYTNDIMPWLHICLMIFFAKHGRLVKWQLPFAIWGILLNVAGTIIVYNGLS